jgi:hypothetical protein
MWVEASFELRDSSYPRNVAVEFLEECIIHSCVFLLLTSADSVLKIHQVCCPLFKAVHYRFINDVTVDIEVK